MVKRKKIQVLSASVLAASAFVTAAPAEAASVSEAEKLVNVAKEAGTILKWAISIEGSADGKTRPWVAYNNAKGAYDKAVQAVTTLPTAQKNRYLAELDEHVNLHITRAMYYIDAITAGEKIRVKQQALVKQLNLNLINDDTEKAFHELSKEIRKQAILLDRVYGKSTRDLIRSHYKQSAENVRNSVVYAVSVKMELDLAQKAKSDSNFSKTERHLQTARTYLPYVENPIMKKTLTDRLNALSPGIISIVNKIVAVEPKRIKVEFNKAMLAGTGSNSAENASNYDVTAQSIKSVTLSQDKKSAIIELYEPLYTNTVYYVTVKRNIQTANYESLGNSDYIVKFTFNDTIKPTVTSVKTHTSGNVEVSFSELIAANSPLSITIDGKAVKYNSLYSDTDLVVIPKSEVDRIGLRKGRTYSIEITGARDLVIYNPNIMNTYRSTFLYNPAADTIPPEVKALQVKDEKTITVEFSETLSSFTASHLSIKKGNTTIKPAAIKDSSDGSKTKFDIELPASAYGANEISVRLNVQIKDYKDLKGNTGKTYERAVTINKDLTPPQFVQAVYDRNKNEIHFTFNKNLKSGLPTVSKIKITDQNNKSLQVAAKSNTDDKMIIDAKSLPDGVLNISVAEGAVKDNTISQNNNRAFTTSVMKKFDQEKPEVAFYESSTNGQFIALFSEPVKTDSATSAANYYLEGHPIPSNSVLSISSNQREVTILLPEGTIKTTNKYRVSASGVKDLADNAMTTYSAVITLSDNTQPELIRASLDNKNIKLTFSESIFLEGGNSDFTITMDNQPISPQYYTIKSSSKQSELLIQPEKGMSFENGNITIETTSNATIRDAAFNTIKANTTVTVTR
ncbi:Ig-like domain-containing protein [Bacillus sp. S/N-304-OC-R1]|uniref:Ig-like domain-containing protein n=1 Tax=Bacillus sp. S/N-304-OC-R1 TaxID=2758034 RepID=UPI001C8E3726|nr:Ig-like domain-containing protein [Bacillus sp. S/N-304-OC-R1]MBY0123519.1 Ig-like domain-containing protein [Bacillus sp. S/N-304-OC-R1]